MMGSIVLSKKFLRLVYRVISRSASASAFSITFQYGIFILFYSIHRFLLFAVVGFFTFLPLGKARFGDI